MKRLFLITIIILLIVNVAFSQEKAENHEPLFTPAEEPEKKKKEEILYTPAEQAETPEEILFTPVVQIEKPEKLYTLTAEIISEFQSIYLDKESSKAQEYRILADGLYIRDFSLYYGSQTQEFGGKFGRVSPLSNLIDDGYGDLSFRRYGLLDVTFGLSKFPHDYANDAKTIFNLENPYTYRVQQSPTTAVPVNVSTQRDSYNLLFKFSPGDRLIISSALTIEERKGRRPFTVESLTDTTQYPAINPTAIIEIAEPVDYTTTAIDLGLEYMDGTIDLQLNNNLRIFANNLRDEVIWDNPYKDAAYGRAKVADDHIVHTLSFKPSVKFTDRIRLINTLSYSKVTSSMDLVPVTTTPGVGGEFLRDVIDSDVRNLLFSSILSARPLADVSLNMKYRYYAHKNDTPKTEIDETPPYVMLDGSATLYPRIPRYMSYNTKTFGLEGAWVITERLSLDAGIENEDISRDEREVGEENKKKVFLTLRSRLSDKLSGMLGYIYDRRRGDYDQTYYKTIYDPNSSVDQHPLLRAFDLSELDLHTIKGGIDYSPIDVLNLGATLSVVNSNFVRGEHSGVTIGRKISHGRSVSIYAEYTPFPALLLYSQYFHETLKTGGSYTWTYDSTLAYPQDPLYSNFIKPVTVDVEDISDTYTIGLDYNLNVRWSASASYRKYAATGKSINLPVVSSTTNIYELNTSYRVYDEGSIPCFPFIRFRDLKIKAGYYIERYRRDDAALDNFPDPVDAVVVSNPVDIFLGIREPGYRLNIFSISLSFYF